MHGGGVISLSVCATIGSGPLTMVAGPIVEEAIGGPEDSGLCADDVMPDPWWTSLRCSLSQSMVREAQEQKNRDACVG